MLTNAHREPAETFTLREDQSVQQIETMVVKLGSITVAAASPTPSSPEGSQDVSSDELYSSWALFLVCLLLVLSLWTAYYLQIKRIRAINETVVSIFAGMFVGLIIRLAPGTMIRDMLVSAILSGCRCSARHLHWMLIMTKHISAIHYNMFRSIMPCRCTREILCECSLTT